MAQYIATLEGLDSSFNISSLLSPPFHKDVELQEFIERAGAVERAREKAADDEESRAEALEREVLSLDQQIARKPSSSLISRRRMATLKAIDFYRRSLLTRFSAKLAARQKGLLVAANKARGRRDLNSTARLKAAASAIAKADTQTRGIRNKETKKAKFLFARKTAQRPIVDVAPAQEFPGSTPGQASDSFPAFVTIMPSGPATPGAFSPLPVAATQPGTISQPGAFPGTSAFISPSLIAPTPIAPSSTLFFPTYSPTSIFSPAPKPAPTTFKGLAGAGWLGSLEASLNLDLSFPKVSLPSDPRKALGPYIDQVKKESEVAAAKIIDRVISVTKIISPTAASSPSQLMPAVSKSKSGIPLVLLGVAGVAAYLIFS